MRNNRRCSVGWLSRGGDRVLHLHGTIERIDHALEFGQDAVAGGAGDAAAMGGDQVVDDHTVAGQGRKGRGLVPLHMPTITLDIGGEDGDQPAFQSWRFHVRLLFRQFAPIASALPVPTYQQMTPAARRKLLI
jgi:hypothetical protein